MSKKFNYTIGRYWKGKSGAISTYMLYSSDVFFGTQKEAEDNKNYIEEQTGKKYKIFKLVEE